MIAAEEACEYSFVSEPFPTRSTSLVLTFGENINVDDSEDVIKSESFHLRSMLTPISRRKEDALLRRGFK